MKEGNTTDIFGGKNYKSGTPDDHFRFQHAISCSNFSSSNWTTPPTTLLWATNCC